MKKPRPDISDIARKFRMEPSRIWEIYSAVQSVYARKASAAFVASRTPEEHLEHSMMMVGKRSLKRISGK